MILNKRPIPSPIYYQDWDNFEANNPIEAAFIMQKFNEQCASSRQIYGNNVVPNVLKLSIRRFPGIISNFQQANLMRLLGIALWNAVDLDNNGWHYAPSTRSSKVYWRE